MKSGKVWPICPSCKKPQKEVLCTGGMATKNGQVFACYEYITKNLKKVKICHRCEKALLKVLARIIT